MVARSTSRSWNYLSYLRTARGFVKITAGACERWNSVFVGEREGEREKARQEAGDPRFPRPRFCWNGRIRSLTGVLLFAGRQQRRWKRFFIKFVFSGMQGGFWTLHCSREVLLDTRGEEFERNFSFFFRNFNYEVFVILLSLLFKFVQFVPKHLNQTRTFVP